MKTSKFIVFTVIFTFLLTSAVFADTLESGSKGTEVKRLQQQLETLGYFNEEITGYFGSVTESAVKAFQEKNGLRADGIVGSDTLSKLFEQMEVPIVMQNSKTIERIQLSLIKMGLYKGNPDGIHGKATTSAIKEFQALRQFDVTGMLDSATEKAILNYDGAPLASRGGINRQAMPSPDKEIPPGLGEDFVNEDLKDDIGNVQDNNDENTKVEPGEYLDWWGFVKDYFKIGTTAQVIDYWTGKTFNIKRTYGVNHADSETLTKEDTAIMKELWGGQWNWARRPAIIVIDGRRIAASIAGMPHAGRDNAPAGAIIKNRSVGYGTGSNLDKIKGNGMDGHFDVHFLNSRTHGTNKISSTHQDAVRKAAGKQ